MKLGRLVGNVLALLAVAAGHSEAAELAEPAFTNSFDDITSGASVSLTWDGIAPQHYPLCVTAQVIERGGDGYKANSYRVNITSTFASILGFFEDGGPSRWSMDGWMVTGLREVLVDLFTYCQAGKYPDRCGGVLLGSVLTMRLAGASDSSYEWTGVPYPLRWIKSGLYQLELRPMSWPGGDPPLLAKSPVFGISEPVGVAGPASSASPVGLFLFLCGLSKLTPWPLAIDRGRR